LKTLGSWQWNILRRTMNLLCTLYPDQQIHNTGTAKVSRKHQPHVKTTKRHTVTYIYKVQTQMLGFLDSILETWKARSLVFGFICRPSYWTYTASTMPRNKMYWTCNSYLPKLRLNIFIPNLVYTVKPNEPWLFHYAGHQLYIQAIFFHLTNRKHVMPKGIDRWMLSIS